MVAEAYEEAAKVSEAYEPETWREDDTPKYNIAERIRTLKDSPPLNLPTVITLRMMLKTIA